MYKTYPINLTLAVDDFGVKYKVKEYDLHLKYSPDEECKVKKDWYGNLYIGITFKWDYGISDVQLPMPGCIPVSLDK